MNGNYYPSPEQGYTPSGNVSTNPFSQNNLVSFPEYADSLFYVNIGKRITVYFSYPDSLEWRDKVFTGTIKAGGKDYLIITDDNNNDIMLWLIYVNYAVFDESATVNTRMS